MSQGGKGTLISVSESLTKLLLIIVSATVSITGYFLKNELERLVKSTERLDSTVSVFQIRLEGMSRDNMQASEDIKKIFGVLDKHEEQIKILQIDNAKRKK